MGEWGSAVAFRAESGEKTRAALAFLALSIVFAAFMSFAHPQPALALENAVCTSCHTSVDMSVPTVDRDVACKRCHLSFAGSHPFHQAGANCGAACHQGWGDSLLTATPRYTDPSSGAAYATPTSKSMSPSALHVIHSSARWPASVYRPTSACASCHAIAACNACHTGAISASHAQHSASGNATLAAREPWTGVICYGVVNGNQTQRTSFESTNQCAAAGCHDLPATQASRPCLVEDYNYSIGGNPEDPAGTSTAISTVGTWRSRANALYTGDRMSYNNVAGSTLSISFTGARLELISETDPYRGTADVLLDGAPIATIDCYTPTTRMQAVVLRYDIAAGGQHTLTVRPTGLKNASARGNYIVVDAVNVYPTIRDGIAPDCTSCHSAQEPDHGARGSHTVAVDTWCQGCHGDNLMGIHEAQTDAEGNPLTCVICHGTADETVKAAVLSGNPTCFDCHATPHATQHSNTWTSCAGVGCHNATNLVGVHRAIGCSCHSSADAKVAGAIAGHNKNCTACHNPMATHGAVHIASSTYSGEVINSAGGGYVTLYCVSCHRANLLADHGTDYTNCTMCHAVGGPRSSFVTWDKTCRTGACHPDPEGFGIAPHPAPTRAMDHTLVASGYMPDGYCQSCHGNPEGWQCGAPFGCHASTTPPATSVDYRAPVTLASQVSSDPVTWKLLVTDVGDGVTATYYSWDGGPFQLYTPMDAVNGIRNPADPVPPYAHTLRYYSVDAANNTEIIKTTNYNVTDSTPPVVSFNGVLLGGNNWAAKSLVMSVVDPKVAGFNTGVAYVYTEVKTYKTTWGWFPYQAFYQPMASFTYPLDGTWDTTRTISPVELYAKAVSQPGFWPTYGGTINDGGGGDAWFEIQYYARDYTGNQSATTYAKLYVDNTAPTTTPTQVSGVWRWKFGASDNIVGADKTYYSFDGRPFVLYTATDATNGVANPGGDTSGAHTLQYYSVDRLGNTEVTKTLNYTVP